MPYPAKSCFIGLFAFSLMACSSNQPTPPSEYPYPLHYDVAAVKSGKQSPLSSYDDFTLKRNWALASCIAKTFKDNEPLREDARSAAGGYFNFGTGLDIYSHLANLAEDYLTGQAYHTLEGRTEIKLLKCIDFFHSAELRAMLMLDDRLHQQFQAIRENNYIDTDMLRQQLSTYDFRQKGLPLTHALYLMEFALDNQQFEVVKLLVELGVNPDEETQSYGSTLDFAFRTDDDPRYLKAMLDGGLSPNHAHPGQPPLLHRAIARGGLNQVQLLVQRGSDINAVDSQGISALVAAIESSKPDIALYLVKQGAAFNAETMQVVQALINRTNQPLYIELHERMTEKSARSFP